MRLKSILNRGPLRQAAVITLRRFSNHESDGDSFKLEINRDYHMMRPGNADPGAIDSSVAPNVV